MKTFTLGKGSFQITNEREAYTKLRLKYQTLAEGAKQDFICHFGGRYTDMDHLHRLYRHAVLEYLMQAIDQAIRDLVKKGIMDIDDEQFMNEYLTNYLSWEQDYNAEIGDQYMKIVLNTQEFEALHATNSENKTGIMGGGFGLEGAAAGIAIATAANAALGVIDGIANVGSKALSTMGDASKKRKIFENPKTRIYLAEIIFTNVFQVHLALADAINIRNLNKPIDNVSDKDTIRSHAFYQNISKGRIADADVESYLLKAFVS